MEGITEQSKKTSQTENQSQFGQPKNPQSPTPNKNIFIVVISFISLCLGLLEMYMGIMNLGEFLHGNIGLTRGITDYSVGMHGNIIFTSLYSISINLASIVGSVFAVVSIICIPFAGFGFIISGLMGIIYKNFNYYRANYILFISAILSIFFGGPLILQVIGLLLCGPRLCPAI